MGESKRHRERLLERERERERERKRRGLTSHSKHWTRPPRSIEERSCMNIIVRLSFSRERKLQRETERDRYRERDREKEIV